MKTYEPGYEEEKSKQRLSKKEDKHDDSDILRFIETTGQEKISRMMQDSANQFAQPQPDATGRAIFRSAFPNAFVQMKLEISQPGDAHEEQADKVADAVVKGDTKQSQSALDEKPAPIQAKSEGGTLTTTPGFDSQLQSTKGSGSKMDASTKGELEQHTGTDLSGVNIHTGNDAHTMSESINAKAFTHGQDIYFKNGNYNPGTPEGKSLLAHEVAHTVQQGSGVERKISRKTDEATLLQKSFVKKSPPARVSLTTALYLYPSDKEEFPDPFKKDHLFEKTELLILYENPEWYYVEAPVFGHYYVDYKQGFIRKGFTVAVIDLPAAKVESTMTAESAKVFADKFYTAFNDPAWFSNTDEEAITDLVTKLSFDNLLVVNNAYKKEYAPEEDDLDIFGEFFDELGEDDFKKILPIIENKRIEDVFDKIGEGADLDQHIALSGNVLMLRYFLYQSDVDEKQVVALMQELGTADAAYVLKNTAIRKDAAGALSFTEMYRALSNPNFPLADKLKWMGEVMGKFEKPGYESLKFMFLSASEEDKKQIITFDCLDFLSRHFTVQEVPEIMDDLGAEMKDRMSVLVYMNADQTSLLKAVEDASGDQRKSITSNVVLLTAIKSRLDAKGKAKLDQLLKEQGPAIAVFHGRTVLQIIDEALDLYDIPEEKVLEYMKVMSDNEKAVIADYDNNNYLERMATAFTTQQMSEALFQVPISLYHKVYWIVKAYTGKVTRTFEYERDLRIHVLTTTDPAERKDFEDYHIGESMFSEKEYALFWRDLGMPLQKRLKYMLEDKDYTYNINAVLDSILASTYEERQAVLGDSYLMNLLLTRFPVTYFSQGERYLRIKESLALEKTDYERGQGEMSEDQMEWANIQLQLPDIPPGENLARATFKADQASLDMLAKHAAGMDPGLPTVANRHHVPFFIEKGDPYIGSQTPADAVEMTVSIQLPGKMETIGDKKMVEMVAKNLYDYFLTQGGKLPQGMTQKNFMNGISKYIWESVNRGKSWGYQEVFAEILGWDRKIPIPDFTRKFGLSNAKWKQTFGGKALENAEAAMWDSIGSKAKTEATILRVEFGPGSPFSINRPGSYLLGGALERIKIIKAHKKFYEALAKLFPEKKSSVADMYGESMGNFKGQRLLRVFKVAGRIMMVVAVGADLVKIIYAKDKLKTTTSITSGWVAGLAASGAYTTIVGPLVAEGGPWAWVAFALGELVVFTAAYLAASDGVAYIYELTLEDW